MKFLKNLSLIASAVMFLFVVGCGSQGSATTEEASAEEAVEVVEAEAVVEEAAPAMDSTAVVASDSLATEAVDSVASEN